MQTLHPNAASKDHLPRDNPNGETEGPNNLAASIIESRASGPGTERRSVGPGPGHIGLPA